MTDMIEDATTATTDAEGSAPAFPLTSASPRRPGRLQGDVTLTLHTFQAGELLLGRPATDDKRAIPSINNFGYHIDQIMTASDSGDIYAAAALVRIDDQLEAAERLLAFERQKLVTMLAANSRLSVTIGVSAAPVVHILRLMSPYAHCAARLIGLYDELVAVALSARRTGFIRSREFDSIAALTRRAVRAVFYAAGSFRVTGTTRDDFDQGNARATEAVAKFGAVPSEILEGERRPAFLH